MFKKKLNWDIRAVILVSLVGSMMGVIYTYGSNLIYNLAKAALLPTGYTRLTDTLVSGLRHMAISLTVYFASVKGSVTLGETLATFGEMFAGGQWGVIAILAGFVQGLGNEVDSLTSKSRKYFTWSAVLLGVTGAHLTGFPSTYVLYGWYKYNLTSQILMSIIGWLSSLTSDDVSIELICSRFERAFFKKQIKVPNKFQSSKP